MTTDWRTPKAFIYLARQVLGDIDLDPASSDFAQRNVEARNYFSPENDGLTQDWFGRVWLSPPAGSGPARFTRKLLEEYHAGRVSEGIAMVPNASDTAWHHALGNVGLPYCVKLGRIRFEAPDRQSNSPPCGHVFFYLGRRPERFAEVFRPIGTLGRADQSAAA